MLWPHTGDSVVFNGEISLVEDPLEVEVSLLTTTIIDGDLTCSLLEDSEAEVEDQIEIDLLSEGE
jgi:hypothetical protein